MYHIHGSYQDIFNRVCSHLAQQGRPARDNAGNCFYRKPEYTTDLACAFGCLYPDEVHDPGFEGKRIALLPFSYDVDVQFLTLLQEAHDRSSDLIDLKNKLSSIVYSYNLDGSLVEGIDGWIV